MTLLVKENQVQRILAISLAKRVGVLPPHVGNQLIFKQLTNRFLLLAFSVCTFLVVCPATVFAQESEVESGTPIALHTNMLYDAVAIPNLGIEVALSRHVSMAANWHYAWWESDKHKRHWKTYGGYAALRYWLNHQQSGETREGTPFRGHHLGLYGQILLYNFEWGGKGVMSGDEMKDIFSNPTWAAGLEYGYTMPLAKRLSLDFTIGVGYLQGRYYEYKPIDTHYVWQATKQRHYLGPTKLEVNLVWLIGRGNTNSKKGGDR